MDLEQFKDDYNLNNLKVVKPINQKFEMWVTPRFLATYQNIPYEQFTAELIAVYAANTDLFIDIGGHYGFYSLIVGEANPDCKIIAFEPVPENYEILRKNIELNHVTNIEIRNQAVSNEHNSVPFYISTASDNCSLIQHPSTPTLRQIEIQTVALDEIIPQDSQKHILVKIDTDGNELNVLEGFKEVLRESDSIQLIIELNPKCCYQSKSSPEILLEKIKSLGYDCYFINDREHKLFRPEDGGISTWKTILGDLPYINLLCKKKIISKNILIFSHSSQLAGSERSLLELTKELIADYSVNCTVILPSHGPLEELLHKAGAATLIGSLNWWCKGKETPEETIIRKQFNDSFNWLNQNLDEINLINPDIIFTNSMVIPWGALAAYLQKKPHVWMVNEFGELDHGLSFYLPFSQVLDFINESSDKIITSSSAIRNFLFPKQNPDKSETIYRYIEIPKDKIQTTEDQNLNPFHIPDACHIVISGTIMKSKGQEDAIRSVLDLINNRNQRAELVIVGPAQPEFLEYLQGIVSEGDAEKYIHFLPFQENVFPIIDSADIVLVCSKSEGFGRVTLESMLMKKAIVATNTGGTLELITDEKNGLLYSPENYTQLADQIQRLIIDPDLRKTIAQNAYQYAIKNFTKENFGGKYSAIILELIKKKYQKKENVAWLLLMLYKNLVILKNSYVEDLTAQVNNQKSVIRTLEHQSNEYKQISEDLNDLLKNQEQISSNLRILLEDYKQHVQVLKSDMEFTRQELEETKKEAASYASSASWVITRPLRKIIKIFRRESNVSEKKKT